MNLKKLNNFLVFDHEGFLKPLKLYLNSLKYDKDSKALKGEMVILEDASGNENRFGKIGFKIENATLEDINKYQLGCMYDFVGVTKASVYGEFRDNLSIICKGLRMHEDDKK